MKRLKNYLRILFDFNMTERHDRYRRNGKHYGYPDCCIKAFIDNDIPPLFMSRNFDVGKNSGFVPCDKHTEMIRNGEITLESLIEETRTCKTQFPVDEI